MTEMYIRERFFSILFSLSATILLYTVYTYRVSSLCSVKGSSCVSSPEEKAVTVFNTCTTASTTTASTSNSGVVVVCWGCNVWHRYVWADSPGRKFFQFEFCNSCQAAWVRIAVYGMLFIFVIIDDLYVH